MSSTDDTGTPVQASPALDYEGHRRAVRDASRDLPRAPLRAFALSYALTVLPLATALTLVYLSGSVALMALAALVAGFTQNALGVLMHEASHTFLHSNRRVNDALADFLVCLPIFNTTEGYRHPHMTHHRHSGSPEDVYFFLYGQYHTRGEFLRGCAADLLGVTAARAWLRRYSAVDRPGKQPAYTPYGLLLVQGGLFAAFWGATGLWYAYFPLWFLPLCTIPMLVNRLRTFVEHQPGPGGEPANRSTVPNLLEYLLIAPYGYSYHFEHHLQMNVPYYQLRRVHDTLAAGGAPLGPSELSPHGYFRTFWRLLNQLPGRRTAPAVSTAGRRAA